MTSTALSSLEKKRLLEAKLAELKQARMQKEAEAPLIMAAKQTASTQLDAPDSGRSGLLSPKNIAARAKFPKKPAPLAPKTATTGPKTNRYIQPVFPVKSKAFDLALANHAGVIEAMKRPGSDESFAFDTLLAWSGLEAMPLSAVTPVVAVSGSTILASGLGVSLLHHHEESISRQKVAILEWGQAAPCLGTLLNVDMPEIGLGDLFEKRCDLTHLILNAKLYRALPNLFVIGQGTSSVDPMAHLPRLSLLLAALSKKFHRVVLSLPSLEEEPRLPQILAQLGLNYALFHDPNETLIQRQVAVRRQWPGGIAQRVTS